MATKPVKVLKAVKKRQTKGETTDTSIVKNKPVTVRRAVKKRKTEGETTDTSLVENKIDPPAPRSRIGTAQVGPEMTNAAQADAGKGTNTTGPPGTKEIRTVVISLPLRSLVRHEEGPGSQCKRNQAQQIEKRDGESSIQTSKKEQYVALNADILEKVHKGVDIVHSLQSELDATRVAMRDAQAASVTALVKVENELASVKDELLAAQVRLDDHRVREKSSTELTLWLIKARKELECRKAETERDLSVMRAELENVSKTEQTHAADLEQAKCAFETVRQILLEDVTEAVKKTIGLERSMVFCSACMEDRFHASGAESSSSFSGNKLERSRARKREDRVPYMYGKTQRYRLFPVSTHAVLFFLLGET